MSRLEPDQDLRERYAAMEDRLSVSFFFWLFWNTLYTFCQSWMCCPMLTCMCAAADCAQKAEQTDDSCREGKLLWLVANIRQQAQKAYEQV